jgi:hypothetical protein
VNPLVARAIAAVGVVCGFLGIWLGAFDYGDLASVSYWEADGTYGAFLLILSCAAALIGVAGSVSGEPIFDVALAAVGSALWGAFAFFPITYVAEHADVIGPGGWLGLCTLLIPLGASLAYVAARRDALVRGPAEPAAYLPVVVALAGAAIVLAGIWWRVTEGDEEGYWSASDSRHVLGILFLALLALTAVALVAGVRGRPSGLLAAAIASPAVFGLSVAFPVISLWGGLDELRAGAWLPLAGSILLAGGALLAWHRTIGSRLRAQAPEAGTTLSA